MLTSRGREGVRKNAGTLLPRVGAEGVPKATPKLPRNVPGFFHRPAGFFRGARVFSEACGSFHRPRVFSQTAGVFAELLVNHVHGSVGKRGHIQVAVGTGNDVGDDSEVLSG